MRTCSKCGETKPASEFYKQADGKDGLRADCKVCVRARSSAREKAKPDEVRETKRRYYAKNAERIKQKSTAWQEANREKSREKQRAYYSRNKHAYLERKARRRAKSNEATPAWSDHSIVRSYYKAVKLLNAANGSQKFSVDHVVPLNHPLVSGLHSHTNLRIIPLAENKAKNNKFWPDMP